MNSLKFANSGEVFPPEFDLFQTPATNSTSEKINYVNYRCKTQFHDGGPLDFTIPATGSQFVDLRKTVLKIKLKCTKAGSEGIPIADAVGTVNLALHSLFSRAEIYFNQKLVSGGDVMYPYKAYLETVLDYGKEAKKTQLSSAGYYKDTAALMESFTFDSKGNQGFTSRGLSVIDGRTWQLEGPLLLDICQQERYVMNQVEINIKLYPVQNEFFFMTKTEGTYQYKIVDAFLEVCSITPAPWVLIAHKEALEKSRAVYPYNQTSLKTLSVTKGEFGFQLEDVYQGLVPREIVIGFVSSKAFNGSYDTNPFNFHHYEIGSLAVYLNGESSPGQPLQMNFSTREYLDGYTTLFKGLDRDSKDSGNDISRHDYGYGYSVFVFNLLPGDYLPLIKRANVRIEGRFNSPLSENVNVIILGKFPKILEIDRERNIFLK